MNIDFIIDRSEGNAIVTVFCFAHYVFVDLHADSDNDIEGATVNNRSESNASFAVFY